MLVNILTKKLRVLSNKIAIVALILSSCLHTLSLTLNTSFERLDSNRLKSARKSGAVIKLGELKHHVFIYKLYDETKLLYRAFCAGSIISKLRVLTSAHCFFTNRKRRKHNFSRIRIGAGVLNTLVQSESDEVQQWRAIEHLYTQRFYRFPAYNLAIAKVDDSWIFNQFVNKIPYTKWNQDFDGVCIGTAVKTIKEIEGGGLVCFDTGDPSEDVKDGVLIGVTSLINIGLPTLHNRVGLYYKRDMPL